VVNHARAPTLNLLYEGPLGKGHILRNALKNFECPEARASQYSLTKIVKNGDDARLPLGIRKGHQAAEELFSTFPKGTRRRPLPPLWRSLTRNPSWSPNRRFGHRSRDPVCGPYDQILLIFRETFK